MSDLTTSLYQCAMYQFIKNESLLSFKQHLLTLLLRYSSGMNFLDYHEHFQNLLQRFPWSCAALAAWRRPLCTLLGSVHCEYGNLQKTLQPLNTDKSYV